MGTSTQQANPHWTRRPVFQDPERYSPERFNRIGEYQDARLRHALLGVAGSGVISGYDIETDDKGCCRVKDGGVYISCGLAIDRFGRMLYWPGGWVALQDFAGNPPEDAGRYTLKVHYAERRRSADGECGCDPDDAAWVEEGVAFTLTERCKPVADPCPDLCAECISTNDYLCGRSGSNQNGVPMDSDLEGVCKEPGALCHVGCGDWLYDADAGLSLACIALCETGFKPKDCDASLEFCCEEPWICRFRKYVYRNPVLFELLQGCHYDLARIAGLNFESWLDRDWDDPVPFHHFARLVESGLSVSFSKPIKKSSITPASIFVNAVVHDPSHFDDVLRLPLSHFTYDGDDGELVRGVTLHFARCWINAIKNQCSQLRYLSLFEFTVRCAMLRDACGCMPDARPLERESRRDAGCPTDKTAQQMPGDDFVAVFRVAGHSDPVADKSDDDSARQY